MPQHRRKQKQEWRWSFDVSSATTDEWFNFTLLASQRLQALDEKADRLPSQSSLTFDQWLLNYRWHNFKDSLIQTAHETLPKKRTSPYIYRDKSVSDELKHLQYQTVLLNRIYYIIYQFTYDLNGSHSKALKNYKAFGPQKEIIADALAS